MGVFSYIPRDMLVDQYLNHLTYYKFKAYYLITLHVWLKKGPLKENSDIVALSAKPYWFRRNRVQTLLHVGGNIS